MTLRGGRLQIPWILVWGERLGAVVEQVEDDVKPDTASGEQNETGLLVVD